MITAPFNFVPLNEKVFFPQWAEDVSHDTPFEDGESGVIDIKITAKSPLFIRDSNDEEKFCNHNGRYYIPGSSVKGMVRNVLEIMSFSKLSDELFTDNTYAVRDLSNAQNFYMKQMNLIQEPFTECGWLKIVDDEYIIEDCATPGRINHTQIDYALGMEFAKHFKAGKFEAKDANQKTSEYKYNLVGNKIHTITVGDMYHSEKNKKYDKREFYKFDKNGQNKAQLVLTGQPTPRKNNGKMGDGKGFEFLFFDVKNELKIDKKVVENFKFAYFDKRDTEPKESPDWKYWKEKLYNGEKIPVFFQKKVNRVLHFGLSYLYKLPYEHSIKEGIPKSHFDSRLDLAQTIFGTIDKSEAIALKGRVQFSHFKVTSQTQELQKRTEILGTPRASYYPIYIKQYDTEFKTYINSDFSIAGRKRYPIHKSNKTTKTEDTGNTNVGRTFRPLKDGVIFEGKLRYHNLKKAEIGAILSALTFHNTPNTFHSIGMAKSLGYGKVEIKIDGIDNIQEYLKEFEMYVSEQILGWSESDQLKEILSMATEQNNSGNSKLDYMKLEEFANNKSKTKDYLRNYTQLDNITSISLQSLIDENDLIKLEEKNKEFLQKQKEYKEAKKKKDEYNIEYEFIKSTDNIDKVEAFISKYEGYSEHIEEAKKIIEKINTERNQKALDKIKEEADKKWEAIQSVEAKHKQSALEKFIKDFSNSEHIQSAKEQLTSFKNQKEKLKQDTKISNLDFLKSENSINGVDKKIKIYLSGKTPTLEEKEHIINFINSKKDTLPTNKKKRKKELKEYGKWIDISPYEL